MRVPPFGVGKMRRTGEERSVMSHVLRLGRRRCRRFRVEACPTSVLPRPSLVRGSASLCLRTDVSVPCSLLVARGGARRAVKRCGSPQVCLFMYICFLRSRCAAWFVASSAASSEAVPAPGKRARPGPELRARGPTTPCRANGKRKARLLQLRRGSTSNGIGRLRLPTPGTVAVGVASSS